MAESYTVFARKYRPQRFSDLIGQPHVVEALTNAMTSGRLAHAFLFTGSRGTGKTSSARILAMALNCLDRGDDSAEPCGVCASCVSVRNAEDLDVVEMDAASNSRVDDMRERLDSVDTRPSRGKYRIYIIDEVHMLSTSAFNALLKTIEEPPAHVKFILATTNPEKIPETILSRVQRYDFRRVTSSVIANRLQEICDEEGVKPGDDVLRTIAESAEGGMRDALGRLDQLIAFAGDAPTLEQVESVFGLVNRRRLLELLDRVSNGDAAFALMFAEEVFDSGKDVAEVLGALVNLTRLLMLSVAGGDPRGLDLSDDDFKAIHAVGSKIGLTGLVYVVDILNDCRTRVRRASFPRVVVETALVKLSMVKSLSSIDDLMGKLDEVTSGHVTSPTAQTAQSAQSHPTPKQTPKVSADSSSEKPPQGGVINLSDDDKRALDDLKRTFKAK